MVCVIVCVVCVNVNLSRVVYVTLSTCSFASRLISSHLSSSPHPLIPSSPHLLLSSSPHSLISQPEIVQYWDSEKMASRPGWNADWAIVDGPGYDSLSV